MNFVAAPRPLQTEECPAVVPALELLLELLSPRARSQPALRGGGLVAPASASSGHSNMIMISVNKFGSKEEVDSQNSESEMCCGKKK